MALQLHIGATRDNNTLLFERLSRTVDVMVSATRALLMGWGTCLTSLKAKTDFPIPSTIEPRL